MDHKAFLATAESPIICELPNPFQKPDGTKLQSPEDWERQRKYLKGLVSNYMHGPCPELAEPVEAQVLQAAPAHGSQAIEETVRINYRVEKPFHFDIRVVRPYKPGKHPAIVWNNFWQGAYAANSRMSEAVELETVVKRGYVLVEFDREQIAPDRVMNPPPDDAEFPALPCGTIMAWGWGHMLINDYLLTCSYVDANALVSTGHSRGGKAALAAGIFDERIAICAPIISGCGGTGSLRCIGDKDLHMQDAALCETVGRITHAFPDWFFPAFAGFGSAEPPHEISELEDRLPFDSHTLRALIAPRAVISCDGIDDSWCNPAGNQIAWRAAQPVFDFLGVPENNALFVRSGGHGFNGDDWMALLSFCDFQFHGKEKDPAINRPYFSDEVLQWRYA